MGIKNKKRIPSERSWCKQGVRFFKRCEYEIIYSLKDKYGVKFLCEVMLVNRSGYYKRLAGKDKPNRYEKDRIILTELLLEQHNKHKTKGYHYLANLIRNETGWVFSDNLAHKSMFITSTMKDYLTNLITKPLFNIELNKGLNNWWFSLSTFT